MAWWSLHGRVRQVMNIYSPGKFLVTEHIQIEHFFGSFEKSVHDSTL